MGKKSKYVVDGAVIKCSSGNKSTTLKVTSNRTIKIKKKKTATMMDFVPGVNLPMPATFGICKILTATVPPNGVSKPCVCATVNPWLLPYTTETVNNFNPLLDGSKLICPIGGVIKINNVKQRISTNKPKEVKCPEPNCNKDLRHGSHTLDGTNKRGDITGNLIAALKKYDGSISKTNHIFFRKRKTSIADAIRAFCSVKEINADIDLYLQVPDPIQGHHLITIGAVDDDGKEDGEWFKLFYRYGYDINCAQNGVLLPGDMLVACHFAVPLHKGGHGATALLEGDKYQFAIKKTYVTEVIRTIQSVKKNYETTECKKIPAEKIKKFHNEMLEKSNIIFDEVKEFNWLITSDGMHYKGGNNIGCYKDCRTLTRKRNEMASDKKTKKKSEQKVAEFVIELSEKFAGEGCLNSPRGRNHSEHGCLQRDVIWEKECRYTEKNEDVENLIDD